MSTSYIGIRKNLSYFQLPQKHLQYTLSELERKMGTLLHGRQMLRINGPGQLPDHKGQR